MQAVAQGIEGHQIVLVVDDDPSVLEGLSEGLAGPNRTIVTCSDVASAELSVEWLKPSHVVSDIRLTGPFGYEGLDFIRFVKRCSPDTRTILMTGDGPDALQLEASERGAVGFLCKPFEIADLDSLLNLMAPFRMRSSGWPEVLHVPTLEEVLRRDLLFTVFQPIVRLPSGEHLGYEALARCRTGSLLRNPEMLFRYASRELRVADLELACIRKSLKAATVLPEGSPIFLNIHPETFVSGERLRDALEKGAELAGVPLNRLVLEITEQAPLSSTVVSSLVRLKSSGIRFAFDDVGVAYSHLPFIERIEPAFMKISGEFGSGFESDPSKTKIVKNILALARDFSCDVILEGIETFETAEAASELGIKFGQGYYFARPSEDPNARTPQPLRALRS